MPMTEEQKKALRAELDKLTPDELKDLNIALKESLEDEQESARTERQKALYAFLHPTPPSKHSEAPTVESKEEPEGEDKYLTKLQSRFKTR